jgi:hypothetical protein
VYDAGTPIPGRAAATPAPRGLSAAFDALEEAERYRHGVIYEARPPLREIGQTWASANPRAQMSSASWPSWKRSLRDV